MTHRFLVAGVALLLAASACGSDAATTADTVIAADAAATADGDTSGSAPADSAPADSAPADSAPADSAPADSAPADGAAGGSAAGGAAADTLPPASVAELIANIGAEPTPELLGCLEDRGIGAEVSMDGDFNQFMAALMGCAPVEMGAVMADGIVVEGVTPEQVQCVMVETANTVGALSPDAAAALDSVEIPDDLRAAVAANAAAACTLTAEQIETILSS